MKKFRSLFSLFLFICVGAGSTFAQNLVTVKGTVSSADTEENLAGVSVTAGTSGTSTSIDGSYSVSVSPGATITFSHPEFQTQQFVVPAGAEQIMRIVRLEPDAQRIDDVVVIAYGERKKGTVAGSVATVKAGKLNDTPTASFDQALQGQATGLMVLSNTGEPSAAATFQIRGINSINSGTSPLFILDGMPISSSDFNAISPSDIESISILKDASSTSIYGARAANGVIVITTKRGSGQNNKAQIVYRMQLGFSQLAHGNWNLMDTPERIQYEKEVGLSAGQDYEKLSRTNVNWLNEVFNSFAPLQSYELQVSGSNNTSNYFVSGGYYNQQGTTNDSNFSRYNFRTNMDTRASNWLKIGTSTMLAYEEYSESMAGSYALNTPISATRFMLPYWNPYKADGSLTSINDNTWEGTGQNPLEWVKNNPYYTKKYKVISNLSATATITKGLTFRTLLGVDFSHIAVSSKSYPSYKANSKQGSASRSSGDGLNLTITNTLNYVFNKQGGHSFNFMVGQEGIDYRSESFNVTTTGQKNDLLTSLSTGTRARSWNSSSTTYSYLSFFGRGEYNYKNRFYADFSLRTDASSRFGKDGRWAGFWSAAFMWDARNEKFLSGAKWLTMAQVAVSTGTTGNSSIPNYDHLALVTGNVNYLGQAGLTPYSKGNENLKWEKIWASNIALHLGFWNRVNLDVEFYNKLTTNMLMATPVSYSTDDSGFRWDNVGGMVNRGIEVNVNADVIRAKGFTWNVNANASYNRNKITELYNGIDEYVNSTSGTRLAVGHSHGEFFMNRFAGVNPANGDALWYTKDGERINEFRESDKVMLGKSSIAPWMGGFGTSLNYKGITLSAQFSWVADRWMINNDRLFEEGGGLYDAYNQSKRMLYDRWKQPGDVTDVPRHGITPQIDTHLLEDASFLRLKNVSLSYSLPPELLSKTGFLYGTRIYFQAQNLLTFTKFTGLDPESSSNVYKAEYPMSRQFTLGLELTF